MRYLKKQVLNRRAPYDQRLQIDESNNILMSSPAALQVPAGTTAQRPITANRYGTVSTTDLSGMIRYNTATNQLEGFQAGFWRSFKFKEVSEITQQNLGAGDGNSLYFGPLNNTLYNPANQAMQSSDLVASGNYGGQNLLVIVENVFQVFNTNYTVALNPPVPGAPYTGKLSVTKNILDTVLYFNTHITATSAACAGTTTATLTFPARPNGSLAFSVGSTITVTGFVPASYNGTYVVTGSTNTTVSYTVASAIANSTVAGNIKSSNTIYPSVDLVDAEVTGSAQLPAGVTVQSYTTDPISDALVSITLSSALLGTIDTTENLTITVTSQMETGYYLKFNSPVPLGKVVTVLHGFDR